MAVAPAPGTMWRRRQLHSAVTVFCLLLSAAPPGGGDDQPSPQLARPSPKERLKLAGENKIRHLKGKYTVREEVVKRVEHSYPCKLVETAVKVTFPGMKSEVLVSFLGYKEPNLMQASRFFSAKYFLIVVSLLFLQITCLCKALVTLFASEWLLSCAGPFMCLQVAFN